MDEYDPENFDWGSDDTPGIDVDSVGPDIIEQLVQAALNAHENRYGWRYLKKSDRKEGAGRLFRVKHYVPEEKREFFEREFPGYTFVWDGALGHHDHPVAHLCTELNEIEMVDRLVESGEQYIDLFGNGGRDRKYQRNCVNMFSLKTPKDYIRYQNRMSTDIEYDMEKLTDRAGALGKINHITMTHSLYYLTLEDVARIVNVHSGRRLHALVHRHSQTHGSLNSGEQEYWVDHNGIVTQRNISTGEYYRHKTLEPLFHQYSAKTAFGGVAWTARAAGGDSFILEFVGCPNEICTVYENIQVLKSRSWEEYSYANISVQKFLHWTWMSATTTEGIVTVEDLDLFDKLRRYVAGKSRTPRLKTETMNYARRLCNKEDIISIHGGGAHGIRVACMKDYVEIAFRVDMKSELDIALSFHKEDRKIIGALNAYYEKGEMPRDFTALTYAATVSARTVSDAAFCVLENIKQAQEVRLQDYGGMPGFEELPVPDEDGVDPDMRVPGPWW